MAEHESDVITEDVFRGAASRLDHLVSEIEALPSPGIQAQFLDLLQTIDALHRAGLSRMVTILREHDHEEWLERVAADSVVHGLLELYDLLPAGALRDTAAAGGEEVLREPASTLLHERAASTPAGTPSGFIPLSQIGRAPARSNRRPGFQQVARLEDLPAGAMHEVDVDGVRVLIANVDGEVYAVRNACPGSAAPLSLGSFAPPIVICPWHNDAFDIRTGQRVDGQPGPPLELLPLQLDGDAIKLALRPRGTRPVPAGHRP